VSAPLAYSVAAAAAAVGISESSIKIAIAKGDITPRFLGVKKLITHTELEGWLASLPTERTK
jgi:hypothetical protein